MDGAGVVKRLKILIAPDSFKGSLSSQQVAEAMAEGVIRACPHAQVVKKPLADGGEGTVNCIVDASGGHYVEAEVMDPLMRPIRVRFGLIDDDRGRKTAVIETATASGLPLLQEEERNPWLTTSYGTGQLIIHALDQGCRRMILGLGGSATSDGGAGILQAFGIRLLDGQGNDLPPGGGALAQLERIDLSGMDPRLNQVEFILASDVTNPLLGDRGAVRVFAPQKGADADMVERLEQNMTLFADVLQRTANISVGNISGSGAAGGIAAVFLSLFKGKMNHGIDLIMDTIGFDDVLPGSDLVITGEGKIDGQTFHGKAPAGVAQRAGRFNVPVIAIVGSMGDDLGELKDVGIEAVFSIINRPMELGVAMNKAYDLIVQTTEHVMRVYQLNNQQKRSV